MKPDGSTSRAEPPLLVPFRLHLGGALPIPFACDTTAIPPSERGAHQQLTRRLLSQAVAETRELPDGLAFRLPAEEYEAVMQFVARERLCCPFVRFTLEVSPDRGPLWLRLTGPDGVKDFLRAELHLAEPR